MNGYRHWLVTLSDDRKNASSPRMWLGTAALVLLVLTLTSFVEPIAGWFQLRFWPALFCFLPAFTLGLVGGSLEQRGRLSLEAYGGLVLVGNATLQLFFAALIAFSRPPGSFALASLLVLTLAFHAYMTRTTLTYPYPLLGSFLAMMGGIALNPDTATLTVFAFVGPTGIIVSLLAGQAGLREHLDRRERETLKQAIYYRALNEKAQAHGRMSERVVNLLRYNHDAGNILSTVFLNAQLLEEQIGSDPAPAHRTSLRPLVSRLLEQLERLKSLINRAHQFAEGPIMGSVALLEVLCKTTDECRALYPGVTIDVVEPEAAPVLSVRVHDGEMGLRRIVENLLHNACEGNGVEAALRIRIEVTAELERVRLRFQDDGPGFEAEQLDQGPAPFRTTKAKGHGLGLFNVTQLVQASGGSLVCTNSEGGGAQVEVELSRVIPEHVDELEPLPDSSKPRASDESVPSSDEPGAITGPSTPPRDERSVEP